MSDSIFEQFFRLLQESGPVNWRLAEEILKTMIGPGEPLDPRLTEEYRELAVAAQLLLDSSLPLSVPKSDLHPVDAKTWAQENQQSFRYLIEPLAGKMSFGGGDAASADPMAAMLQPLGPALLGMQAGSMVGAMSQQILGQFDGGLPPADSDRMYLVVPNVERFATEHNLDAQQVRMWAAMHEVAYHAVLEVDWVRPRFAQLVDEFYETLQFDPSRLTDALGSMEDPMALQEMLGGPSAMSDLMGATHDIASLDAVQAFAAFIEGYTDYAVGTVAGSRLPQLERIAEAHHRRRTESADADQTFTQFTGLELQRHRAKDAAEFCDEVQHRWGEDALPRIWEQADRTPTLAELTDPVGWAARVLLD